MGKTVRSWGIPTELNLEQFRQFVLPHVTVGRRGPVPKLSLPITARRASIIVFLVSYVFTSAYRPRLIATEPFGRSVSREHTATSSSLSDQPMAQLDAWRTILSTRRRSRHPRADWQPSIRSNGRAACMVPHCKALVSNHRRSGEVGSRKRMT